MTFNSFEFLAFFGIVFLAYLLLPRKTRPVLVAVSSVAFYAIYNWKVTVLLMAYTVLAYFAGRILEKKKGRGVLALLIIAGLLPLILCKYLNFGLGILARFGISIHGGSFGIFLPLGISYFTFKVIGYLVDVYKDETPAEKNFIIFTAFVTFFAEMPTGPIDRANGLMKQLHEESPKSWTDFEKGVMYLLFGYFEKMVVADRLGMYVDAVYSDLYIYEGITVLLAIFFYSVQIYMDFAGCTHMAIGVAGAMGIKIPENFERPYLAVSVADFWRRWHMSLMKWLKDYIYIPLGGNRKGTLRKYFNIMVVFIVSGMWHGAGTSFVIWGGLNGILQIIGTVLKSSKDRVYGALKIPGDSEGLKWWKRIGTFILMSGTWVFFRAQSTSQALLIFEQAFKTFDPWVLFDGSLFGVGLNQKNFILLWFLLLLILIFDYAVEKGFKPVEWFLSRHFIGKMVLIYILLFAVIIFGVYGSTYDAANFIYMQF